MYHNTNNEQGLVLERSEEVADRQQDVILDYFRRGGQHTPDEVWQALYIHTCDVQ